MLWLSFDQDAVISVIQDAVLSLNQAVLSMNQEAVG